MGTEFLIGRFFPFSFLNMSHHSLLACRFLVKYLLIVLWGFPCTSCFSLVAPFSISYRVFPVVMGRRQWHPTPVLLPGKSHGRRSLVGCCPWGREADMTERLHFDFSLSCIGEGNGNPLQFSCQENPGDGGAWWAAVYGVAQSWTRLKQLSSSRTLFVFVYLTKLSFIFLVFL